MIFGMEWLQRRKTTQFYLPIKQVKTAFKKTIYMQKYSISFLVDHKSEAASNFNSSSVE